MAEQSSCVVYRFDDFEVDPYNRQLRRAGEPIPLNSKYFDVLHLLIQRRGQLTTKEYLFDKVWDDVVVTDSALSQCIKDIRKQLRDDATHPRYIKTVPKHGFIFTAEVVEKITVIQKTAMLKAVNGLEKRPYKFLDYYTEQDESLFFGREAEIDLIASKIMAHRSFIIHGRSGVGKSSIARAGLTPELKRRGAQVFVIRSFKDPLEEIIESLKSIDTKRSPSALQNDQVAWLWEALNSQAVQSVIIFLDQFEDFFLLLAENKRKHFIETLLKIFSRETISLKLVFILREDLLAEMSRFKRAIPEIFHHEYRLGRLNHEQASRAIVEPARAVGCHIAAALPKMILRDLSEDENIDPPQMQIVCDVLFDGRDRFKGITVEEYQRLGGASRILTGYLQGVMNRFHVEELVLAEEILKTLITADKSRLVLPLGEVERRVESITQQSKTSIVQLIEELGRARIIRFRRQEGEAWVEVCHDFLIQEISKWLSEEDAILKRARALLDRALENSHSHQLLIDRESLQIILAEGPFLGLKEEEADLLALSTLKTYGPVPDWLVQRAPHIQKYLTEKMLEDDPEIRIRSIESSASIKNENVKSLLHDLALWDNDLLVRKAASIKLIEQYGSHGQELLSRPGEKKAGVIRRAISLAFVRDYEKGMVFLTHLPFPVAVLVTLGLMWVRIIRARADIVRQTGGGTLGASFSGLTVGFLLGSALAMVRPAFTFEATTTILVLMSLGSLAGAFGGFGVSLGIIAMQNISFRHSHYWSIFGGALGGFTIGGLLYILEVDIFRTLFGQSLSGITGGFEGLVIGLTLGLGRIVGEQLKPQNSWAKVLGSAVGSMMGAFILTSIEGNLFSGSIEIIAKSFSKSQINLEPLASLFGEVYFGKISRVVLGAVEGFLFGGFMSAGMEIFRKR